MRPDPSPPLVLGVGGSPREGGNSDLLLEEILDGAAEEGAAIESLQLRELRFQGCVGCEKCRAKGACVGLKDDMTSIYPTLLEAQGLILVSPTHNYNVTSWMKAFIDRLYCYYDFQDTRPRGWTSRLAGQGRKAVIGAICEQTDPSDMGFTLDAMRYPLEALGYELVGELPVFGIFDSRAVGENLEIMARARELGGTLARSILA